MEAAYRLHYNILIVGEIEPKLEPFKANLPDPSGNTKQILTVLDFLGALS